MLNLGNDNMAGDCDVSTKYNQIQWGMYVGQIENKSEINVEVGDNPASKLQHIYIQIATPVYNYYSQMLVYPSLEL